MSKPEPVMCSVLSTISACCDFPPTVTEELVDVIVEVTCNVYLPSVDVAVQLHLRPCE